MTFPAISKGSAANDGTGTPARTAADYINNLVSAANAGQLGGFKNHVRNGAMRIAQRGAGAFTSNGLTLDGWRCNALSGTTMSVTQQAVVAGSGLPETIGNFLRMTIGTSAAGYVEISQIFEGARSFAGRTVIVSFYARASVAMTIPVQVYRNFGSGGSAADFPLGDYSTVLSTSWQRFEIVFAFPTVSGKTIGAESYIQVFFARTPGYTALGDLEITGCQIEYADATSPKATPFEDRPIGLELALCQRFYQAKTVRTENGSRHIPLAPMRTAPSVTVGAGSAANITADGFELSHSSAADCAVTASAEF